jgi:hypothetical protein
MRRRSMFFRYWLGRTRLVGAMRASGGARSGCRRHAVGASAEMCQEENRSRPAATGQTRGERSGISASTTAPSDPDPRVNEHWLVAVVEPWRRRACLRAPPGGGRSRGRSARVGPRERCRSSRGARSGAPPPGSGHRRGSAWFSYADGCRRLDAPMIRAVSRGTGSRDAETSPHPVHRGRRVRDRDVPSSVRGRPVRADRPVHPVSAVGVARARRGPRRSRARPTGRSACYANGAMCSVRRRPEGSP